MLFFEKEFGLKLENKKNKKFQKSILPFQILKVILRPCNTTYLF